MKDWTSDFEHCFCRIKVFNLLTFVFYLYFQVCNILSLTLYFDLFALLIFIRLVILFIHQAYIRRYTWMFRIPLS